MHTSSFLLCLVLLAAASSGFLDPGERFRRMHVHETEGSYASVTWSSTIDSGQMTNG